MNKKILILRILFSCLLIFTYLIIFSFSCENGEDSSNLSKGTMYKIIDLLNGDKEVTQEEIDHLEPLLRKLAHFGVYAVSGLWSMGLVSTFYRDDTKKEKGLSNDVDVKRICVSSLIGFLFACSDEIHQIFSEGRSGKIVDVCIDTTGVAFGSMIFLVIYKVMHSGKIEKK